MERSRVEVCVLARDGSEFFLFFLAFIKYLEKYLFGRGKNEYFDDNCEDFVKKTAAPRCL